MLNAMSLVSDKKQVLNSVRCLNKARCVNVCAFMFCVDTHLSLHVYYVYVLTSTMDGCSIPGM